MRINGAPGRIRTCDMEISNPRLWSTELRAPIVDVGDGDRIRTGMMHLAGGMPNHSATPSSTMRRACG